ncbi:hypothetical protein Shyd_70680 [Streptomyces hydrogenans]|uniref:Uncharacterized protein n=1 Tax=Streptomyces hydrogenans TaxID=1873719 RepID=A0ABQ3PL01_9ACTN|nr:hypothetical protein Shyd_70680 [Streptomyces hydrogenans]
MQGLVERERGGEVAGDGGAVEGGRGLGQGVGVAGDPSDGAGDGQLQEDVVGADQEVEPGGELGDLVGAADVAAELLDGDDVPVGVEAGEQGRGEVDLGVDGVVVGDDRQPRPGDLGVVGADGLLVGAVGVGRQEEDGAGAGLGGLLGPAAGLGGAVGGDAGHDAGAVSGGGDGGVDDRRALGVGEGLVLAQRAVGHDAVAAVGDEPADVLGVGVEVDGEVLAQRQGGGDHDAVPGAGAGVGHRDVLLCSV